MIHQTLIYLDGGDPEETRQAHELLKSKGLGGLDGQTTNPTLIAKNLSANDHRPTHEEAIAAYKKIVQEMRKIMDGPISIQVIGDPETMTAEEMLSQARERIQWISNAVIKFPCTHEGLKAVEEFCEEGPVNVTLVFSQEQAAAVYAVTRYRNYDCYISPFVGRFDDRGENGMDLVSNILQMYAQGDGHVKVLTASARTVKHIQYALWLKSPVITIPFKLLSAWEQEGFALPESDFFYHAEGLSDIPYEELSLDLDWREYNIHHDLTDIGLKKFWDDWRSVVA